jgi:hypothetical protein
MTKNGILCEVNGKRVNLDPKNSGKPNVHSVIKVLHLGIFAP